ncbi:pantoate--beta-alanine ligase [Catenuloplanes nepalensis]|uniref:Pantothenate synthetase n=1 Tax=Catenuloplanes nepalensis TaxID=587533 RepID=A0ABT9N3E0_9ACTN|nr:pantoate--beta-alanine ligase [Catenuloplanes nepalensis]MDP9798220.1 pantoate--beta-alanine ligase [Catenuloplanes nepalensis]
MTTSEPRLVNTVADLNGARAKMTGRVAVVMTMGALHDGHESLMRAARERADHLIVTIFVNPLQFGPNEDLDRYPRTLESDLEICARAGVDLVFAPSAREMYPDGPPQVRLNPGPLGEELEGASRPGFFHGVLTVVLKLLQLTRPDLAFFGEKDYQQLTLVTQMARDLNVPVEVVGVPTVREPDGLALSSRNRYLSAGERASALALSAGLRTGAGTAAAGGSAAGALAAAHARIQDEPGVRLDYLVLLAPDLGPAPEHGPARMLVAARVGTTRLIDNIPIELS